MERGALGLIYCSAVGVRIAEARRGAFRILQGTGLDPTALELELTESVLMKRAESMQSILKILRGSGIQLAVDDFGTGYSSLSYLRNFPIDALKIDHSLRRGAGLLFQPTRVRRAVRQFIEQRHTESNTQLNAAIRS